MDLAVVNVDKEKGMVTIEAKTRSSDEFSAAIETLRDDYRIPHMALAAAKEAGIATATLIQRNRKPYAYYGEGVDQDELTKRGSEPLAYRVDIPVSNFSM